MLFWIFMVIITGFGLMIGIELLLTRLGIRPADPDLKAGGVRDIARKLHRWSAERRTDR
jgi:hypothetical protein